MEGGYSTANSRRETGTNMELNSRRHTGTNGDPGMGADTHAAVRSASKSGFGCVLLHVRPDTNDYVKQNVAHRAWTRSAMHNIGNVMHPAAEPRDPRKRVGTRSAI